jgi:hypothetical protein
MPATWTTDEQVNFLKNELSGFCAAQHEQHGPQFLKGLIQCWFERWPKCKALFFSKVDAPVMALTAEDDQKLSDAVAKRTQVRPCAYGKR